MTTLIKELIVIYFVDIYNYTDATMESQNEIQNTDIKGLQEGNRHMMPTMFGFQLQNSFPFKRIRHPYHISCVTSDQAWVSDNKSNTILTNTAGNTLNYLNDIKSGFGVHTVNSENELIYIDSNNIIKKLSKDMKNTIIFIDTIDSTLKPLCVFWSLYTEDLLIGLYKKQSSSGIVMRYNKARQLTQTIQHDNSGLEMFHYPIYLTENNNGDVVVSDYMSFNAYGAVVVTKRSGEHRFSYTGYHSRIQPRGVCTDALSQILVCDGCENTIQMLNKDGRFLSYLLLRPSGIEYPHNLSYDVVTYRLWVGSQYGDNKICVYRYIPRDDSLTGTHKFSLVIVHMLKCVFIHYLVLMRNKTIMFLYLSLYIDAN